MELVQAATIERTQRIDATALRQQAASALCVASIPLHGTTVAVTGHRPSAWGTYDEGDSRIRWVKDALDAVVGLLVDRRAKQFVSGMALGVDTWFAEAVLGRGGSLTAAVPFDGQDAIWPEESAYRHHLILAATDRVHVVSPGAYAAWKMDRRNAWMVEEADFVLAVWNGTRSGGTYNCIQYALSRGKHILCIDTEARCIKLFGAHREVFRASA